MGAENPSRRSAEEKGCRSPYRKRCDVQHPRKRPEALLGSPRPPKRGLLQLDFSESSDREEGINRSMPSGFQKRQPVLIDRLTAVEHLLVCKLSTFAQKRFSKFFFQELCRK